MKFTGERYVSDMNSAQISYEHWHRYFYATQFVKGKDVLDIACGEGYGTNLISQTANSVVGVDISEEAIGFAKERYLRSNTSFVQGSIEKIPIDGAKKFDIVISFETIEHVNAEAQENFLKEVKRLLKNDGIFVVSTPNKLFYSDITKFKNEFHLREFYEKEFVDFLRKDFKHVSLLGQKVFTGSNIWPIDPSQHVNSFVEYQVANNGQRFVVDDQEKNALYLLAVCSDVNLDTAQHSLLFDTSLSLLSELFQIISKLDGRITMLQDELRNVYTSKKWRLIMKIAAPVLLAKAMRRDMLAIIREVVGKFNSAVLALNKIFYYIRRKGVKESFLTIIYRAKHKRPIINLTPSARVSLQNVLNLLAISIDSDQVVTTLINMLGQERTGRIMANIVDAEKFISTQNNGHVYPLIYASQLPIPLSQIRKRNILFITSEFPSPYHGGGNRVLNFIKALSADNNIYLCTAFLKEEHEHVLPKLTTYCRGILKIPFDRFGGNQDKIRDWLGATTIDIVHYEWPRSLENYAADFGRAQIFTFMEATSLRFLMDMERLTPLSAIWLEKLERLAYALWLEFVQASKVDLRIAVTEKDAKFFSNLYPFQRYSVLNHGLDFNEFVLPDIEAEPHTLVFVGNYLHCPNAEALEFFFNEIWGNICKEIPDIRIYVVGANPTNTLLRRSDGKQIIITGAVADVRPYIQKAAVCIAPLISGAGLRGKVIEYAALHRPFVATSIASTDLIFKNGIDYFCADTAQEFSNKIITLLKDPQLARKMAEAAYVVARNNYDNQRLIRFLLSLYEYVENGAHV